MKNSYSLVSLKRWSSKVKDLPAISNIKTIHVYDFDNTLFSSPLPNPQIWHPQSIGMLQSQEGLAHGGWWHDSSVLEATGQGVEKEEPRAWEGCWNEPVVQLVESSVQSKDVVTILLTGRGETNFADLINRICNSRKLDFDMVVLKPEVGPSGQSFESTMSFKQEFLRELAITYKSADEIRIYEDRPRHVKGFREYFERFNKSLLSHRADEPAPPRLPITAEVVHVCELKATLNPEMEVEVVQRAINRHNHAITTNGPGSSKTTNKHLKITDSFLYFGYMISQTDSSRLISLINAPPQQIDSGEVRLFASSILIAPYYPKQDLVTKVGGRGKKVTWQVTGVAKYEDRIWAARVAPVTETPIVTQDPVPLVVLAMRKGSRQVDASRITNWSQVSQDKAFMFESTVADKVMLKIEDDDQMDNGFANGRGRRNRGLRQTHGSEGTHKRKFGDDSGGRNAYARIGGSGTEREDGNWAPKDRVYLGGRNAQRNAKSKAEFNNRHNPNVVGARGGSHQGTTSNAGRGRGGGGAAGPNRGGGRSGGGGHVAGRGPAGYRSLDDYGTGNFDGANESVSGGGANGEVVMNY
ncbi:hypothetical protein PV10_00055 [Exophiala mesophila]|uniref:Swiss Army Knife RNA repair protein HAD domain-containing protein n=1 Tax=Exophiala mesophila TaxID=212818 RepID=A0A0D1ZNE4_EXOME|nr:uncharacterized protein PV10_00055 [Exophiala mesophila]KIV96152.1 hypothetical protein PV10_00055 [Exophiala mesophila]